MMRRQFRVLCRQFLFRIVDLELLSPQGDMSKLIGQLIALLGFASLLLSVGALFYDNRGVPVEVARVQAWATEHQLISTTMLTVGLFSVLSWDSMFLNRVDVLVLGPLPIQTSILFLAKITAVATSLAVTVIAVNVFAGFAWPIVLGNGGFIGLVRCLLAYWTTMWAAGVFVFSCVLAAQGIVAQVFSRRLFLRISSLLQVIAFAVFLSVYFLEPVFATPAALSDPRNYNILNLLPDYWFLGLFQLLNGSVHPSVALLVKRALIRLGLAILVAGLVFLLAYIRTIRKIVEEPDITPGAWGWRRLPRLGRGLRNAVAWFSIRTILRSRQHRGMVCFYLGVAFAIAIFYTKTAIGHPALADAAIELGWARLSVAWMVSSVITMCMAILGARVAFTMPLELRANWLFRAIPLQPASDCVVGSRRALLLLTVLPVCAACAVLFFSTWSWYFAIPHLAALALLGTILTDVSLHGFGKIPFTCSYLPGKSNVYVVFWMVVFLGIPALDRIARYELKVLQTYRSAIIMLVALAAIAAAVRITAWLFARSTKDPLRFEETPDPAVFALDLHRDGVPIRFEA